MDWVTDDLVKFIRLDISTADVLQALAGSRHKAEAMVALCACFPELPNSSRDEDQGTAPLFSAKLAKLQPRSILPLLVHHLGLENYVSYTCAAITIDQIMFVKHEVCSFFFPLPSTPIVSVLTEHIIQSVAPNPMSTHTRYSLYKVVNVLSVSENG